MHATREFDDIRHRAFGERMLDVLNGGALALMTSIGHRTGLFDALARRPGATSDELARAAGLQERYVREWLGAMVTGRMVELAPVDPDDPGTSPRYTLPAEHAAWLTGGSRNLALEARFIPLLAAVEEGVLRAFRDGGGVPYADYPRFQRLMAEHSAAVHDASLLDAALPLVPGAVERLRAGIDVLDVGCGRGHAVNLMARAFPRSRFTGIDLSREGVEAGRAEARAAGLANARFAVRDAATLRERAAFDLVTAFDAIHDQARPAQVLARLARALRPDGALLMADIAASSHLHRNLELPLAPFLYTVSTLHCMTVSLAQDGAGLGTMWGEERARALLTEAGFASVAVHRLEEDLLNAYYVARPATPGPGEE